MRGKNFLYTTSFIFGLTFITLKSPITTSAHWYENPFVKLNIGYGYPEKLKDHSGGDREDKRPSNAMLYSVGWGYKLNDKLSTYLDYTNFRNMNHEFTDAQGDSYQHNVRSDLFNLNLQYFFNNKNHLMPYITAGAGLAKNKFGSYTVKDSNNQILHYEFSNTNSHFAWNIGAGIDYKINNKVSIGTNYKYFNLGKIKSLDAGYDRDGNRQEDPKNSKFHVHTINLGLTYHFN